MCVLLIIYPLRTNHTHATTPYDISVFSNKQLRRNNAVPLPLINPQNYVYQFRTRLKGQEMDRKGPKSHLANSHANTAIDTHQQN